MWNRRIAAASLAVLVLTACGDGGQDAETVSDAPTAGTTSPAGGAAAEGAGNDDQDSADDVSGVGTVTVDGQERPLARVVGMLSCNVDDPSGDFNVSARSEDGSTFLNLTTFGDDPGGNEFSVRVDDVEYATESPDAVDYELEGRTVRGAIDVVPMFEEGTAQTVTFEVTCPTS